MKSRLSLSEEKKSKKRLFLTIIGTVVILYLLIRYGISFLIGFSAILSGSKGTDSVQQTKNNIFVAVPVFSSLPSATNSASISVSGTAEKNETIKLFINDNYIDVTDTKNDGSFTFKDVSLNQGENKMQVKAKKDANESDFSDAATVLYKTNTPSLTIDNPSDGQSFSKEQSSVAVTGKTDPDVHITVNDFWAIVDDQGKYSYTLHLQNGDNQIKVVATDAAGNKTEKSIKVTYAQ